jgi:hypothetical protein
LNRWRNNMYLHHGTPEEKERYMRIRALTCFLQAQVRGRGPGVYPSMTF